jgi:hypothetical protein
MPLVPSFNPTWPSRACFVWDLHQAFVACGLSATSAALLVAHAALSTGWGRAAENYRLAGIKAAESQPYVIASGTERNKTTGVMSEKTPMKWRAFSTLREGAQAMIDLLKARYAGAWTLLQAGDPSYFEEVGREGWYTEYPETVGAGMRSNLAAIQKILSQPKPSCQTGTLCSILIGFLLGYGGWKLWKRYKASRQ